MNYYQELVAAYLKSQRLAQPYYDYLRALDRYHNDVNELVKKWRSKRPGLTYNEILNNYSSHIKTPEVADYYKKLQDILGDVK